MSTTSSTKLRELLDDFDMAMLVTRTAYTPNGLPIEHAYDRYRADRTRIALRTGIDQTPGNGDPFRAEIR